MVGMRVVIARRGERLMMRVRWQTVAILVSCGTLVAGCSSSESLDSSRQGDSGDPPATAAPSPTVDRPVGPSSMAAPLDLGDDPCAFLTPEDLELATGIEFDEGVPDDQSPTSCRWTASDPPAVAELLVIRHQDAYAAQFAEAEASLDLIEVEIPGADRAYARAEGTVIGVGVDDDYLKMSLTIEDLDGVLDRNRQLVGIALSRL